MKKVIIGLLILVIAVAAVLGYLMFNINDVAKSGIEVAGSRVLGVKVTVDTVNISIFDGQGSIRGLTVANPEGYDSPHAVTVDELSIHIDPGSIRSEKIHIYEIVVANPAITYEGNLLDSNLQQLQKAAEINTGGSASDESEASEEILMQIDRLLLDNVSIGIHLSVINKTLSSQLPSLELNDLGQGEGATVADVVNEILIALNQALKPIIEEAAPGVTDKLKEVGEKVTDKLKGLFRR